MIANPTLRRAERLARQHHIAVTITHSAHNPERAITVAAGGMGESAGYFQLDALATFFPEPTYRVSYAQSFIGMFIEPC